MKKTILAMLQVAAVTAVAASVALGQAAATQAAPAQAPAPKKEMKDPAEYNAYMSAEQQTDNAAKISGFEAFVTQYPNSTYKEDALELLMGAYEKSKNQQKELDTAQRVLQVNPCNLRALAVSTYVKKSMATGANAQQSLTEAGQTAEKGLQCVQTAAKPAETSDADWQKLKTQVTGIFNDAAGMSAYAAKDYAKAEQYLRAAVDADPTNLTDVYYLALADLTAGPTEKDVEGLFFIARASNLAQGAGKDQIAKFGKSKYTKYHGSDEGWSDLLAKTATTTLPAGDFTIKQYVPPTPAEQAADLVKSKKVEEMSFAEWQLVLSVGTPEDADKVWSALKGKPQQMQAHIISIDTTGKTSTKLMLAGSQDDIDKKVADIDLTMSAVIPKKDMPKEDTDFQFQATPVSYVAKPFVITMEDGALLVKAAPKPPARRKPSGG